MAQLGLLVRMGLRDFLAQVAHRGRMGLQEHQVALDSVVPREHLGLRVVQDLQVQVVRMGLQVVQDLVVPREHLDQQGLRGQVEYRGLREQVGLQVKQGLREQVEYRGLQEQVGLQVKLDPLVQVEYRGLRGQVVRMGLQVYQGRQERAV